MEKFMRTVSDMWGIFSTTGAEFVSNVVFNATGIELARTASLGILLSAITAGVIVMFLMLKRPSKPTYLMESGRRYSKR